MEKTIIICATALLGFAAFAQSHRFSTTVEKERPQLNDETKRLIAAYHRNPTEESRAALRKQCEKNYEKILERKKAKLEELKRTFARAEGVGLPEDAKRLSREAVARGRARHQ